MITLDTLFRFPRALFDFGVESARPLYARPVLAPQLPSKSAGGDGKHCWSAALASVLQHQFGRHTSYTLACSSAGLSPASL